MRKIFIVGVVNDELAWAFVQVEVFRHLLSLLIKPALLAIPALDCDVYGRAMISKY